MLVAHVEHDWNYFGVGLKTQIVHPQFAVAAPPVTSANSREFSTVAIRGLPNHTIESFPRGGKLTARNGDFHVLADQKKTR